MLVNVNARNVNVVHALAYPELRREALTSLHPLPSFKS